MCGWEVGWQAAQCYVVEGRERRYSVEDWLAGLRGRCRGAGPRLVRGLVAPMLALTMYRPGVCLRVEEELVRVNTPC